jgi:hypothetical protein
VPPTIRIDVAAASRPSHFRLFGMIMSFRRRR